MQLPAQAFSVVPFLGVIVQLVGAALVAGLFALLRRFVIRRAYFTAWLRAWVALTIAIVAVLIRYLFPGPISSATDHEIAVRVLYFAYQTAKTLGFILFVRGTMTYVAGRPSGVLGRRMIIAGAVAFAALSTALTTDGLNGMMIWQGVLAAPAFAYCAAALISLPPSRRTLGSVATATGFGLLAVLWLLYVMAFGSVVTDMTGVWAHLAKTFVGFNSYFDLILNVLLGFGMVVLVMEDAKREVDDAQAELRVSHDQLRRAALFDVLTECLNRRAFVEGVGLEMVRATFGTVVLADLDNLKQVNDLHGHAVGDRVLRRCADAFRVALRPYDKLYRWGGDEFLLIMPSARGADILARLESAIAMAESVTGARGHEPIRLQVSLGAADYSSAEDLAVAIDGADQAMYVEKLRRKGPDTRDTPSEGRPITANGGFGR